MVRYSIDQWNHMDWHDVFIVRARLLLRAFKHTSFQEVVAPLHLSQWIVCPMYFVTKKPLGLWLLHSCNDVAHFRENGVKIYFVQQCSSSSDSHRKRNIFLWIWWWLFNWSIGGSNIMFQKCLFEHFIHKNVKSVVEQVQRRFCHHKF